MKTERLLYAIGKIDDQLIADVESESRSAGKSIWLKWGLMAAGLALAVGLGIAASSIYSNMAAGAFTMDVNPSVEYIVARNGMVKDAVFLNSDAEQALKNVTLKKQSVETAVTRTIAAYEAGGYIKNGQAAVLVSFDCRLSADSKLKNTLSDSIQKAWKRADVDSELIFQSESGSAEADKLAAELNVSRGKADRILAAAAQTGKPAAELAQLPLNELLQLPGKPKEKLEEKPKEKLEEKPKEEPEFIGLDAARAIALKDAGLDVAEQKVVFTQEELNRNQGKPCYLLEFYTGEYQYYYKIDAKTGDIWMRQRYIRLAEAKRIAIADAGCADSVTFSEESLVAPEGVKTPYYHLIFANAQSQWEYKIDAVLASILEKKQKDIGIKPEFIGLETAKAIALKDAGLDDAAQKVVFTKEELNRNQGKPCYLLEFYTGQYQYYYKIDAKTGDIWMRQRYIRLEEAKKIAIADAGCADKVTFSREELIAPEGIKTPYYHLIFVNAQSQWEYKIDAVLASILEKKQKDIGIKPEFIGLETAQAIALKDAGLDDAAQKVVFTREELNRNQGKPCYLLEFYTGQYQYFYKIDAKTGDIWMRQRYIRLEEAKRIAIADAACADKVTFSREELIAPEGVKTPYYHLIFANAQSQWEYKIDAVLASILEKQQKDIGIKPEFISLEAAKAIALKDAGLDAAEQKVVFTREELNRNQGKPCYLLEFYTGQYEYFYKIDAKTGDIWVRQRYIRLEEAKRIAIADAGCREEVTFILEELITAEGIKTPYYHLIFANAQSQWEYKIDAVLAIILEKQQKDMVIKPEFIGLETAKAIALKDAGLDETAQKVVFTKEELNRNQGKPCYLLEFYTGQYQYYYKIDAKTGDIWMRQRYIRLEEAKRIAIADAGCREEVTFILEELVAPEGVKTPYYHLIFANAQSQWEYKIDAVLASILEKKQKDVGNKLKSESSAESYEQESRETTTPAPKPEPNKKF